MCLQIVHIFFVPNAIFVPVKNVERAEFLFFTPFHFNYLDLLYFIIIIMISTVVAVVAVVVVGDFFFNLLCLN